VTISAYDKGGHSPATGFCPSRSASLQPAQNDQHGCGEEGSHYFQPRNSLPDGGATCALPPATPSDCERGFLLAQADVRRIDALGVRAWNGPMVFWHPALTALPVSTSVA